MKLIKYFIQFVVISFLLILFKMLGFKIASNLSSKIFTNIGPLFRSKNLIKENIIKAYPNMDSKDLKKIIDGMWGNYGRILSEYVFMKNFRDQVVAVAEHIGRAFERRHFRVFEPSQQNSCHFPHFLHVFIVRQKEQNVQAAMGPKQFRHFGVVLAGLGNGRDQLHRCLCHLPPLQRVRLQHHNSKDGM